MASKVFEMTNIRDYDETYFVFSNFISTILLILEMFWVSIKIMFIFQIGI